nr:IS1182 family transposase [Sedimentibacter sp.]
MQRYVQGENRDQIQMMSLEERVSDDNPVRVIDAFVESLDMKKLDFTNAETKHTGRKPFDPKDMVKLYIYSYFNGIRSSRKIERECERNFELMWLINSGKPHNKTISEFRRNNKKSIENMFKDFSMLCDQLGLIGKEIIAIDGSKFRACNSRRKNFTKNKVKKMIEHYENSAKRYIELLENSDKKEEKENKKYTVENIQEKIKEAQQKIEELKQMAKEIEKNGEISLVDKDAKHMSVSNNGTDISHNVQTAVDDKNHLVVAIDVVSNPADQGQLFNMASKAAEELGIELKQEKEEEYVLTVVADKGYYEAENLKNCLNSGIQPIVSKQKSPNITGNEKYTVDNFKYEKEKDVYICPDGYELKNVSKESTKNKVYKNKEACKNCSNKDQYHKSPLGKRLYRNSNHEIYDKVNKMTIENMEI